MSVHGVGDGACSTSASDLTLPGMAAWCKLLTGECVKSEVLGAPTGHSYRLSSAIPTKDWIQCCAPTPAPGIPAPVTPTSGTPAPQGESEGGTLASATPAPVSPGPEASSSFGVTLRFVFSMVVAFVL